MGKTEPGKEKRCKKSPPPFYQGVYYNSPKKHLGGGANIISLFRINKYLLTLIVVDSDKKNAVLGFDCFLEIISGVKCPLPIIFVTSLLTPNQYHIFI